MAAKATSISLFFCSHLVKGSFMQVTGSNQSFIVIMLENDFDI